MNHDDAKRAIDEQTLGPDAPSSLAADVQEHIDACDECAEWERTVTRIAAGTPAPPVVVPDFEEVAPIAKRPVMIPIGRAAAAAIVFGIVGFLLGRAPREETVTPPATSDVTTRAVIETAPRRSAKDFEVTPHEYNEGFLGGREVSVTVSR